VFFLQIPLGFMIGACVVLDLIEYRCREMAAPTLGENLDRVCPDWGFRALAGGEVGGGGDCDSAAAGFDGLSS
jgi:hypothetical protein